jgi:methylated-DNA-protein-cysteine methyltransferase-like protein
MKSQFHSAVIDLIRQIPEGMVATYGQIAAMAGNPRGARQVVRVLHSSSDKHDLPWHRVVNRLGHISLPKGSGYEMQKSMLEAEGVEFNRDDRIDMRCFLWSPG